MVGISSFMSLLLLCSAESAPASSRNLITSMTAAASEGERTLRSRDRSYINPVYIGGIAAATIVVVAVPTVLIYIYREDIWVSKASPVTAETATKKPDLTTAVVSTATPTTTAIPVVSTEFIGDASPVTAETVVTEKPVTGMDGTAEACFLHNTVYNVLEGTKQTHRADIETTHRANIETAKACNDLCVGAKEECDFWMFLGGEEDCFLLGNNGETLDTYPHGSYISGPKGSKNCATEAA